jgi:hypothetical protein
MGYNAQAEAITIENTEDSTSSSVYQVQTQQHREYGSQNKSANLRVKNFKTS